MIIILIRFFKCDLTYLEIDPFGSLESKTILKKVEAKQKYLNQKYSQE